ncbi:MAG: ABC transporter permease [Mesorhizobium sp.]|uniref:ABC transporter permease n=2 Tax=Mesorhizobium TaxID=68287 RepID=A0AB36R364_9HYPH|nr:MULTISPECIES: ABC transporter permease [Mesorhizobium]RUU48957.1 ABC transporter permease [Mesorhizobium sp. M6A.T.Ca.TU.002.02.2.1]AZO68489.1 ABC transporter permease [Mesorhizobium sp. M6A.T.Cr.TU.016.01.1.1]PAP98820.1 ABC transporter permease [Mesorhizobium mediterraneum]RUU44576.1 ABC transporter permease [Mesorhizobium sp. M6A.T.Ce.TU.002.03.1.1]RUV01961.1 ABC transporter permease [Mesorhizobium sp. M6A.T.Cr.TU.017.01.1.1]
MNPVVRTVLQRLGLGLITLFIVTIIIFSAIAMLPGDFAKAMLGQSATPETVAAFQREIGIDRPPVERYFAWVGQIVQGDFGSSFASRTGYRRTVAEIIAPRLYNTMFLAVMTALIAVPLALGLGILAALYRNSWFDRVVNTVTLTTISFPEFFVAYMLAYLIISRDTFIGTEFAQSLPEWLAASINWVLNLVPKFPTLANISDRTPFWEHVWRAALPSITLTLVIVAHMMRMTRVAIINMLASPYIDMARLKGMSPMAIVLRHALPNAWAPIVTVIAFNLAYLIVGVVVVEVVFVYPGIGQLMVDAVKSRDVPVVQACALIFAATYILLNLTADIISIATNPRLLHPR